MKIEQSKSLPTQILRALGTGLVIYFALGSPGATRRLLKGIRREWGKHAARTAVERLHKKGLVDFQLRKDGALVVQLSKEGKERLRVFQSGEIELSKRKWDGYWRVISFDIPESQKKAREALRARFRAWNLYPLQKSVYVSPYPCGEEILMVRELFGIRENNILILKTRSLPNQNILNRHFRL